MQWKWKFQKIASGGCLHSNYINSWVTNSSADSNFETSSRFFEFELFHDVSVCTQGLVQLSGRWVLSTTAVAAGTRLCLLFLYCYYSCCFTVIRIGCTRNFHLSSTLCSFFVTSPVCVSVWGFRAVYSHSSRALSSPFYCLPTIIQPNPTNNMLTVVANFGVYNLVCLPTTRHLSNKLSDQTGWIKFEQLDTAGASAHLKTLVNHLYSQTHTYRLKEMVFSISFCWLSFSLACSHYQCVHKWLWARNMK